MKIFPQVVLDLGGNSVTVDATEIVPPAGHISGVRIKAAFGLTTVEHMHTFGPVDGGHAAPDPAMVQNDIDTYRMQAARRAVMEENIRLQFVAAK